MLHAPPKPTCSTLNTPPLSRTDPHKLTHKESMFGDTGCGARWGVSETPNCLLLLFWGFFFLNINGKVSFCWCFPVSKLSLFVFTLTNGKKRRRKVQWKKEKLMTTRCFFPFPKNVSPCKSTQEGGSFCTKPIEWFWGFLKVCVSACVCADQRIWLS